MEVRHKGQMKWFTLVVLAALPLLTSCRDFIDCYVTDNNPYLMFGSKTAYDLIYERPRTRPVEIHDCEPVQLWLMARHGTRTPSKSTIKAMQQLEDLRNTIVDNHEERKNGRLCYGDLDRLKVWKLNVSMSESKMLTHQGKADLYFLAKRLRTKFPALFTQGYSQNLFVFRHTDTERTKQSAAAFGEGMFGQGAPLWLPAPLENDTVIKPYSNCTAWRSHVRNNSRHLREIELFKVGSEMANLIHNVSHRLGFQYDLASDAIQLMYDMCRYDKAWNVKDRSAWCGAFAREELLVLEYLEDLKSFYEAGYGHEYNIRLGCTPIKDLLLRFTRVEDETDEMQPNGVFYFTHSDMLAMTIARLGIAAHGLPMRHDNFYEQRKREWRSSELTPFASNLASVFYKCKSGDPNRIMFFLNEKVVDYPGCDLGLCSWSSIKERFKDVPFSCDLGWCSHAVTTASTSRAVLVFFSLLRLYS